MDCGAAPGHAMAALRHGFKFIRYRGARQIAIEDIAAQTGATVLTDRPDALDLETGLTAHDTFETACLAWLEPPAG